MIRSSHLVTFPWQPALRGQPARPGKADRPQLPVLRPCYELPLTPATGFVCGFTPDASHCIIGGRQRLAFWDLAAARLSREVQLDFPDGRSYSTCLSPDASVVLAAPYWRPLLLAFSLSTGGLLGQLSPSPQTLQPRDFFQEIAFSGLPGNPILLPTWLRSAGNTVTQAMTCWVAGQAPHIHRLAGDRGVVLCPDQRSAVVGDLHLHTPRRIDLASGETLARFSDNEDEWFIYQQILGSPNGCWVLGLAPARVYLWNALTGELGWTAEVRCHSGQPSFSPDGSLIALPELDARGRFLSIHLRETRTGRLAGNLLEAVGPSQTWTAPLKPCFSPCGRWLAAQHRVWDLAPLSRPKFEARPPFWDLWKPHLKPCDVSEWKAEEERWATQEAILQRKYGEYLD